MPWRETCAMEQRKKFVDDWLDGQWNMTELCETYGVSRKTGYKWLERFETRGAEGLEDLRREARSHPNQTRAPVELRIMALRRQHPFWGPRKLKSRLERLHPDLAWPASSTIGGILRRRGLVMPRRRRQERTPLYAGPYLDELTPNDVWAADFKGWFRTQDGTRIDPLTMTDCASRYLIRCHTVRKTDGNSVRTQFTAAFREFGMPKAIKTDNGTPFASKGLGGLSPLAVWLVKLGITPQRTRPAHPQDNGAHERMHKTLKQATAKPPKVDAAAQQKAFERFRNEFNEERPHEALGMKTPSEIYAPSSRPFPARLAPIAYPSGALTKRVNDDGTIWFKEKRIYVSKALADEYIRMDEEGRGQWDVYFGPVALGQLDLAREMIKTKPAKVLPMRPV